MLNLHHPTPAPANDGRLIRAIVDGFAKAMNASTRPKASAAVRRRCAITAAEVGPSPGDMLSRSLYHTYATVKKLTSLRFFRARKRASEGSATEVQHPYLF